MPRIHVGIGGWVFPEWRDNFYPKGLPQKQELDFASRHLTSIEINGTFYGGQKPASFAHWHDETPKDFVFSLKASRYVTSRRVLAEAGPSMTRFLGSGLVQLKAKLGPINWQFLPTKAFDPADFEAFLALLPKQLDGVALRHVVEVRHESFAVPEFTAMLRRHGVAVALADNPDFPRIEETTAGFAYVRLQCASADEPVGYAAAALDEWAARIRKWKVKDVFLYFINGHKPKAPAAAMALIERLGGKAVR
jgi:uncharacterized protein YecE (DUF72 family)